MPASKARKLSQLMSEGGSLDTQIDSSGTSGEIGGGATVTSYANFAAFSNGTTEGDLAFAQDTNTLYVWDGSEWDRIYSGAQESIEWTTEPPNTLTLNADGSTSTITSVAVDPDSFPVTYTYDTNPTNQAQATIVNNNNGSFTFTPSTSSSNAGRFI
jgi:asparagine N-glycosylation enzyme membrane subunit Stt3